MSCAYKEALPDRVYLSTMKASRRRSRCRMHDVYARRITKPRSPTQSPLLICYVSIAILSNLQAVQSRPESSSPQVPQLPLSTTPSPCTNEHQLSVLREPRPPRQKIYPLVRAEGQARLAKKPGTLRSRSRHKTAAELILNILTRTACQCVLQTYTQGSGRSNNVCNIYLLSPCFLTRGCFFRYFLWDWFRALTDATPAAPRAAPSRTSCTLAHIWARRS